MGTQYFVPNFIPTSLAIWGPLYNICLALFMVYWSLLAHCGYTEAFSRDFKIDSISKRDSEELSLLKGILCLDIMISLAFQVSIPKEGDTRSVYHQVEQLCCMNGKEEGSKAEKAKRHGIKQCAGTPLLCPFRAQHPIFTIVVSSEDPMLLSRYASSVLFNHQIPEGGEPPY